MYSTERYYIKYETFEKWALRLRNIGMQRLNKNSKCLFQYCCLLMCLIKRSNGNMFKANEFSCTFDSMMNHYYRFLNHDTIADVLQNTSIRNGIRTRSFPISIGKSDILYVYYDRFLRIVDVQVNHDYGIMRCLNETPFDLMYNWRGKNYCYAFVVSSITGWTKLRNQLCMFVTNLRNEKEQHGNLMRTETENCIFKIGNSWPPIDYDCKLGFCDCNGQDNIDIRMCKRTAQTFIEFNKKKLVAKARTYSVSFIMNYIITDLANFC